MESFKRFQTETPEIKNWIEFIRKNDECEGKVSDIEDKTVNYNKELEEAKK